MEAAAEIDPVEVKLEDVALAVALFDGALIQTFKVLTIEKQSILLK